MKVIVTEHVTRVKVVNPTAITVVPESPATKVVEVGVPGVQGPSGIAGALQREVPSGMIDGINDDFTLSATPGTGTLMVYVNGLAQTEPDDYDLVGSVITFVLAPLVGDRLLATFGQEE